MSYEGIAKVQHYVPQFLLRNFGTGKKEQLYAFDKVKEATFKTNVKNVAAESRFYDFTLGKQSLTIEPFLSKVESAVKPIFEKLLKSDSLAILSASDRQIISTFLAIQYVRTKASRAAFDDAQDQFVELLKRRFGANEQQLIDAGFTLDNDERIAFASKMIVNAPRDFGGAFMVKDWLLVSASPNNPFMIGDHPLALQNTRMKYGPYGNIGLMVTGIEIYFPISPGRALAMFCPTIGEEVRKAAGRVNAMGKLAPHMLSAVEDPDNIMSLAHALDSGAARQSSDANIENFNWLQIVYAERFVFSARNEFDLAKRVISQSDDLRRGRRMKVT